MRVLYLITRAERGGAQVHVLDLLRGYADLHDCHVATGEEGFLCEMAQKLGVPVHQVSGLMQPIRPLKDLLALVQTVSLIRRIKPNLIHAHTSKAGLVGRLAGVITRTPVVFTVHMWSFTEGFSRIRRAICLPLEKLLVKLSARTINVSEANQQLAIRAGIGTKTTLTTIRNAIPDVEWRSDPARGKPVRIVMVGRFVPPKDQRLLIKALSSIESHFELLFIGSGPDLDSVRDLVARLKLTPKVKFLLDRDDVPQVLSTAQIFVLASNWEGLPLSILEAMRAGLPVVASDIGGIPELICHNENGLLIPPGDADALRDAIVQLLSDPALRVRLGNNGRRRYEFEFSYEAMLSKTQSVYADAVGADLPQEQASRERKLPLVVAGSFLDHK